MSLGARATKGGAKTGTKDGKHSQDKGKGSEKQQPKDKVKPQATTEQLRMAHMIDRKSDDASDVRRMVLELMEMTCRTEEEVCSALHDSDNDMVVACNLLLEESQRIQGEWQTNEKKKKKPATSPGNGEAEPSANTRSRSGPRPRRGEGEGGRGRGSGRGRGGRGARGGRGGRRSAPARPRNEPQAEMWCDNQDNGTNLNTFPATEDWDNEEWSGSLSDTKVFTPSVNVQNALGDPEPTQSNIVSEDWDSVPDGNNGHADPSHIPSYTYHNSHAQHTLMEMNQPLSATSSSASKMEQSQSSVPPPTLESLHAHSHQPMGMSGSLSAAQSQYLSQLTQQSQRHEPAVYTPNYGVYATADISNQRKPQRARVPPPSKIPATAVEMPGGGDVGGTAFIDVQFGALDPDALVESTPATSKQQAPSQVDTQPVSSHPTTDSTSYPNSTNMLTETLSVVDTAPSIQPVTSETTVPNNTTVLENQLSVSMKQLNVGVAEVSASTASVNSAAPAINAVNANTAGTGVAAPPTYHHQQYTQHRPKHQTVGQQSVYAHHAVSHHPPVYGANVYAPQVNSTNASLTAASAMSANAYPPTVTLSQYHTPTINSYQTSTTASHVYGGSALYTAAPYSAYQPTQAKISSKDTTQYDSSAVSSNSLTNTSTSQAPTAKVSTTSVSSAGTAYAVQAQPQAFYTPQQAGGQAGAAAAYAAAYAEEAQMMRGTLPHHMGGYYEVGYGVGGAREGGFGLGAGERFGRADAASPQQVAASLPPGYAYFYQPPPTTYQYGVYPTYGGGGSTVGGVGVSAAAGGKVSTYAAQQQPPYDAAVAAAQDTYKTAGGAYNANATKTGAAAAATADLTNAMYAKAHVALNKVNNYEKAAFHSGTPPPFGAGSHHMYIPGPPQHHLPHHHAQQQHQMDVRVNSSHNRRENSAGGARNAANAKPSSSKPTYSQSYWAPN